MNETADEHHTEGPSGGAVVFVLDGDGVVLQCTSAVLDVVGRSADECRGRRMTDLVADPGTWEGRLGGAAEELREFRAPLLHRDGSAVSVDAAVMPIPAGGEARCLVCVAPSVMGRRWVEDQALLRALFDQDHIGLVVHGTDLRARRGNLSSDFLGIPLGDEVGPPPGADIAGSLVPEDTERLEGLLRDILETGEPLIESEQSARPLHPSGPDQDERTVSLSAFRLHDTHERVIGVAAVFTDVTEQRAARRRLALQHAAAERLGRTLDVQENAEELTRILASDDFADLVCVDLSDTVFQGQETGAFVPGTRLRRIAVASSDGVWPEDIYQLGETVRAREAESAALSDGATKRITDMNEFRKRLDVDTERRRLLLPGTATSALFVPLLARGSVLGVLGLWRTGERKPFAEEDVPLINEISSRAALSLENARRYTTELRTVETLQRSLLPPAGVDLSAAETAGTYIPASTAAGVGGSWYDVIPLSSTRVAFVIGDVAGHGLNATATMGRLRTAVQTLADLDLAPEELLTHLDDLVARLGQTEPGSRGGGVIGTNCLYCVYDPVTGRCVMASAGHPPPILTGSDGHTRCVDLKPGPALGVGGMPFEPSEMHLGAGSVLAFYTSKLTAHVGGGENVGNGGSGGNGEGVGSGENVGSGGSEPGEGTGDQLRLLREGLAAAVGTHDSPAEIGRAALDHVLTEVPADDVALLVARVRALPEGSTAAWRFAADPPVVAEARELVTAQLTAWDLEDLAFTTELIVSELVTNAIRYAGAPISLRLIRDKTLICEVSDPSQTQPHLRRARPTDEGGRGLFLIAQLAHRWGSRYTHSGKTLWTEQPLTAAPEVPPGLF